VIVASFWILFKMSFLFDVGGIRRLESTLEGYGGRKDAGAPPPSLVFFRWRESKSM